VPGKKKAVLIVSTAFFMALSALSVEFVLTDEV
jgi:hypothetical protein